MFLSRILNRKVLEGRRDSIEATSTDYLINFAQKVLFHFTKTDSGNQLSVFVIPDTEKNFCETLKNDFLHLKKKQTNALEILNEKATNPKLMHLLKNWD